MNIDVIVTDREHRRVLDLQPDDFELLVDGRPVPIEYFAPPRGGKAPAETASSAAGAANVEARGSPSPTAAIATITPTNLILYVDQTALENKARQNTLDELREFLGARRGELGSGDGGGVRTESACPPAADERSGAHRTGARRTREATGAGPTGLLGTDATGAGYSRLRPKRPAPGPGPRGELLARRVAAHRAGDLDVGRSGRSIASGDRSPPSPAWSAHWPQSKAASRLFSPRRASPPIRRSFCAKPSINSAESAAATPAGRRRSSCSRKPCSGSSNR